MLPNVTTITSPTCVCGLLPQRSVQNTTILYVLTKGLIQNRSEFMIKWLGTNALRKL